MPFKLMPTSISNPQHQYKLRFSTLATALAISSTSHTALAQNEAKDVMYVSQSPFSYEKIAVAQQVEVINAQAPELQSATSVLDLLKGQAGVLVTGAGSTYGQSLQMRGYDQRGVKITIDNVTQDFNSGLFDATFIDPALVKKVTVHKGGGSLHHGNGALAGVVSIKTLNASDLLKPGQHFGGHVTTGINRNDHSYHAGATLFSHVDTFDTILSYQQRKIQLNNPYVAQGLETNEEIHNWMLKTTWFAHPAYQTTIQLKEYRNNSIGQKQPSISFNQTLFPNTPHERSSLQRDIHIGQHFSPNNTLNWQANWDFYYSSIALNQLDLIKVKKTPNDYREEDRDQYTYGTKFTNSFIVPMNNWANNAIQSGFEYYQQEQKSNEYSISYPNAHLLNSSGWLNNDLTLHHLPITFSAGTRFTYYKTSRKDIAEDSHTNWSSRFAVSATPSHWLNLFSSYSEGYRTPRMAELYNNSHHFRVPFIGYTSDFIPSPDLKPETNKTVEAGMKFSFDELALTGDSLQFGSTVFHTKAKNHIALDAQYKKRIDRSLKFFWLPEKIYYINVPSATIKGVESFVHYKTHWFDLDISHNLIVGKEDETHHTLSSLRPNSLVARFNAPIAHTGVNLGWVGEFAARSKFDGDDTYVLPGQKSVEKLDRYRREVIQYPGYSLHDFYISYQADQFIKGLSSTLALKNAFDKNYVSSMGVPQEGRNFYFNLNYKW
ncbi:TPA: TonB-dependent receptor [Providencia rettgeri]